LHGSSGPWGLKLGFCGAK